ncbi:SDR family oxidoreductase [Sphaerisporangium sp. NPDC051017]|uniref:SDR family NAD(P)-dependent oxidoreductase n=1 Tax=Sphaerisporangium sp. NPDC051017 TaxID=3154636 RepID=UPI00342DED08
MNNAGLEQPTRLESIEAEALTRTLRVNLQAPVLLARSLLPQLRRSAAPSVVNITSIHDAVPYAGNVAYVASKAGLEAAGRTMALELAAEGIRVNSIAPGVIETDMNREVIDGSRQLRGLEPRPPLTGSSLSGSHARQATLTSGWPDEILGAWSHLTSSRSGSRC